MRAPAGQAARFPLFHLAKRRSAADFARPPETCPLPPPSSARNATSPSFSKSRHGSPTRKANPASSLAPQVIRRIESARSTLLFTNTRSQTEIWFQEILSLRPDWKNLVAMHHGSLDRAERDIAENGLRDGSLKCVVAKLKPGSALIFAGRYLKLIRIREKTATVAPTPKTSKGKVAIWNGSKMSLSTELSHAFSNLISSSSTQSHPPLANFPSLAVQPSSSPKTQAPRPLRDLRASALKKTTQPSSSTSHFSLGTHHSPELQAVSPILALQKKWSHLPDNQTLLIEFTRTREGEHLSSSTQDPSAKKAVEKISSTSKASVLHQSLFWGVNDSDAITPGIQWDGYFDLTGGNTIGVGPLRALDLADNPNVGNSYSGSNIFDLGASFSALGADSVSATWRTLTFSFDLGLTGYDQIVFEFAQQNGVNGLDNFIVFAAIPEPSTALAGLLLAAGLLRRRR